MPYKVFFGNDSRTEQTSIALSNSSFRDIKIEVFWLLFRQHLVALHGWGMDIDTTMHWVWICNFIGSFKDEALHVYHTVKTPYMHNEVYIYALNVCGEGLTEVSTISHKLRTRSGEEKRRDVWCTYMQV